MTIDNHANCTEKSQSSSNPVKNGLLAMGLMLFLAICFKLVGELSEPTGTVSQSDSVLNEIQKGAK